MSAIKLVVEHSDNLVGNSNWLQC